MYNLLSPFLPSGITIESIPAEELQDALLGYNSSVRILVETENGIILSNGKTLDCIGKTYSLDGSKKDELRDAMKDKTNRCNKINTILFGDTQVYVGKTHSCARCYSTYIDELMTKEL